VSVEYKREAKHTEIVVKDDGEGISQIAINAITERGRRLDTYTEGQGLGLALVVDMLESYGGELKIQSEKSIGSKFRIILPHYRTKLGSNINTEST
jgi:two-component system sensor histidine kinase PhoQ